MKRGKQRKIMWSVLPREIEENILSRLPVKSLIRFRCVSKHWCNLFTNDPHFIKLQLNRSTLVKEGPKLFCTFDGKLYYLDVEKACGNQNIKTRGQKKKMVLQREVVLPFRDIVLDSLEVSGSCNGLLCLSTLNCFYLLNPATKEYKKLPYPPNFLFKTFNVFGFGYSPRTDEYKVMIISYCMEGVSIHCDDVYVYTLGTNSSSWRSIGGTEYRIKISLPNALVNGALHWIAESGTPPGSSIVPISFDLGDEKFRELSLPKSFSQEYPCSHSMGLLELDGFLSVYNFMTKKFYIWVMKDYGDERSWTKVLSAQQSIFYGIQIPFKPLYILKKDEVLLCRRYHRIFRLDVVKKEARSLRLSYPTYDGGEKMCWESLVSLRAIGGMDRGNIHVRREKEGGRSAVEGTGNYLVLGNKN